MFKKFKPFKSSSDNPDAPLRRRSLDHWRLDYL